MADWILVLLKMDGGGSGSMLCSGLKPDPIFPEKIVLENVQGFSMPFADGYMKVRQWSLDRDTVINWMVGPVRAEFDISLGMLGGKEKKVPWPPGSMPHTDLVNHPEEVTALVEKDGPEDPPAQTPPEETLSEPKAPEVPEAPEDPPLPDLVSPDLGDSPSS
jgi:hypothetical protein